MNDQFLPWFLQVAMRVSGAERGMALDLNDQIVARVNLEDKIVQEPGFIGFNVIHEALTTGDPILTNNLITDPSDAPTTNTNFAHLRIIVVIPVSEVGAIYIDQPIRMGVIPQPTIDRLMQVAAVDPASVNEMADLLAEYDRLTES